MIPKDSIAIIHTAGEDGLLVKDAAKVLGISDSTLYSHMDRHSLEFYALSVNERKTLRKNNVIPFRSNVRNIVSQAALRHLIWKG